MQPVAPVCRKYLQEAAAGAVMEIELFLNSVPQLAQLSREDKMQLVDAFTEEVFAPGSTIIKEGDPGDKFYIIKRYVAAALSCACGEAGVNIDHMF